MTLWKTFLFTLLVPGTAAGLVPACLAYFETPGWRLPGGGVLGWPLLALGASLYLWCAWDFSVGGHGTPSPTDPPRTLVTEGLYRHSRNPMYVGVLLVLLGEALVFASPLVLGYALAILVGFHLRVIHYEEPVLRRSFGTAYEDYRARVPRWLGRVHRHAPFDDPPTHDSRSGHS